MLIELKNGSSYLIDEEITDIYSLIKKLKNQFIVFDKVIINTSEISSIKIGAWKEKIHE